MLGKKKQKEGKRPLTMGIAKNIVKRNTTNGIDDAVLYFDILASLVTYIDPENNYAACCNQVKKWIREAKQEEAERERIELEHEADEHGFDTVDEYVEYLKEMEEWEED